MGFKDLECFNQAMLAKQASKILNRPHCLLARFLKSIYFAGGDFLSATVGARPSYAWRSLLFGRELLQKGLKHRVGNGLKTRVWLDKWVDDPLLGPRAPGRKNVTFDVNIRACSLIDSETRKWNQMKLQELFVQSDVELISRSQPVVHKEDFFIWMHNKSGIITVKSAYWLASMEKFIAKIPEAFELPSLNGLRESTWKLNTAPKIRVFIWKAMSNALPVADLINARGMKVDDRCQACGEEPETINHVLFGCHVARQVWALSSIRHPVGGRHDSSVYGNLDVLINSRKGVRGLLTDWRRWPWILWNLWKRRNAVIFKGDGLSCEEVVQKSVEEADEWFMARNLRRNGDFLMVRTTPVLPLNGNLPHLDV